MRGSDPDAALHYLARLLEAGDLPSATRRLMVCACEDVGLAYPMIIPIVKAAVDAALQVGLPEARIPLADAVVLVATAPKSNSAYDGINRAMDDVQRGKSGPIPRTLQNVHYDGSDVAKKASFTAIRTITRIIGSTSSIFRMPCSALRTITTETTKTSRRLKRIGKT